MGKINASDKIVFENQKKNRKYGNKRNFYIYLTDIADIIYRI